MEAQQCTDQSPSSCHESALVKDLLLYRPKSVEELISSSLNTVKLYDIREPIGYAVLLGSEKVNNRDILTSVSVDLKLMHNTLTEDGWDIFSPPGSELRKETLGDVLDNLGRNGSELARYSVFMFYYTGHGVAEGVHLSDGGVFSYSDIVKKVSEIETLREKPKIFIFDCCRKKTEIPMETESTYLASKNQFRLDLITQHDQQVQSSYPPRHSMICFSATDDCVSYMDTLEGSFFTLALCHAMQQMGGSLSLTEIITQASGGTHEVACHLGIRQNPILFTNLEKQLVLNTSPANMWEDLERDCVPSSAPSSVPTSVMALQETRYSSSQTMVINKGQGCAREEKREGDVVERDHIPKEAKIKWRSKQEIVQNVKSLGKGISVFFIYAPNPDDPYKQQSSHDLEQRNKYLMSRLFFDLERHGFHVLSDLHLGDEEPNNWVLWYVSRIKRCDFVIFVCSPAFKKLFQEDPPVQAVNTKSKRLLEYRNAVYAEISNELTKGKSKKFIPVVLDDRYQDRNCVPLLFQAGTVYRVSNEDGQRRFDYENRKRDFERLVCHMTGINRLDFDERNQVDDVPVVKGPFHNDVMGSNADAMRLLAGPPPGYVLPDQQRPPPSLVGPSQQPPSRVWGGAHGNGTSTMGAPGGPIDRALHVRPFTQDSYAPQQSPYYFQQYAHQNPQPYGPPPHQNPQLYGPPPHQNPQPYAPPSHQNPQPYAPPPQPHQSLPGPGPDPSSLPLTHPDNRLFLWLSDQILQWKFFARYLGIPDRNIEEIEHDHYRDSLVENRYQMLKTWERLFYDDCTYRKLGEVIRNSKENGHLYEEYVRRVNELEHPS